MSIPTFSIVTFIPEAPGLDMVCEADPEIRAPAESTAWVRFDDVLDLILQAREQGTRDAETKKKRARARS